jgi:hypothetical protein
MNVLVSTLHEPCAVIDIVDCTEHMHSGGKKDATYIASLFDDYIEELDPHSYQLNLIIFDGASNVQKAGRLIEARHPQVSVFHGAEHVVSLFFSDVAKIPFVNSVICNYRRVYRVFGSGSMHAPYAMFQKQSANFNDGRSIGLLRPADTRMAGFFIAFHRMLRLRLPLMATLASAQYKNLKLKKNVVKQVENFLENTMMWKALFVLVRCLFPPLRVLRLADKCTPGMDQLYYFVRRTDFALENSIKHFETVDYFSNYEPSAELANDDDEDTALDDDGGGANDDFQAVLDDAYDGDSEEDGDDDTDTEAGGGEKPGIGESIIKLWYKRRPQLVSDFAIAGWLLSPLEEIREDAKRNKAPEHAEAMDRVLKKLYHNRPNDILDGMKDTFWTEWDMFQSKDGSAYGPERKYIWNSELLRRRQCAQWHAQYSAKFTKVSSFVLIV